MSEHLMHETPDHMSAEPETGWNRKRCVDCGKELSEEDLASTDPRRCDSCETQRGYDLTSADVVLPLATGTAMFIAENLEFLASVDEGENTDRDELWRVAKFVRSYIEDEEEPSK